jgi:beta-galactosidase
MGVTVDVVPPDRDPAPYALLVVPMPVIGRDEDLRRWQAFVENGGTLLVTAPAGYRSEYNTWLMAPPPGPLAELLGVEVVEHDTFSGGAGNAVLFGDETFAGASFCSVIELHGAEAMASYAREYYQGQPAVTRRSLGRGRAYFLGAVGSPELYAHLLDIMCKDAGLERHPWASPTLEVIPLAAEQGQGPLLFVLNHSENAAELPLPGGTSARDLLTGRDHSSKVALPGYGLALLQG